MLEDTTGSSFLRENSSHKATSKLADSTLAYDSRAIAGYMKALQSKVRRLEDENQSLRETVASLEEEAESNRETWKSRLVAEIDTSKERELELIEKFQRLNTKLQAESKRIRAAETAYKDSLAEMSVRLEQAQAANASLTARLEQAESDCGELASEKADLERRCAALETEAQLSRHQLTSTSQQLTLHPADVSVITIEDVSQPAPGKGGDLQGSLMDEIRREIADAKESVDAPRQFSRASNESHIGKYLHDQTVRMPSEQQIKRSVSVKLVPKRRDAGSVRRESAAGGPRLLSMPSSPIVFNPTRESRPDGPKICVKLGTKRACQPVRR